MPMKRFNIGPTPEPMKADIFPEIPTDQTAEELTPLEVMLQCMKAHWKDGSMDRAVELAIAAAPYVHPRAERETDTSDWTRFAQPLGSLQEGTAMREDLKQANIDERG